MTALARAMRRQHENGNFFKRRDGLVPILARAGNKVVPERIPGLRRALYGCLKRTVLFFERPHYRPKIIATGDNLSNAKALLEIPFVQEVR